MTVSVKICGLTDEAAVQAVIAGKVEYAGFVYFPASPRHLSLKHAALLKRLLPATIRSVSVLVDPDDELLTQVHTILNPDYVQLHGKETPQRVAEIHKKFQSLKIIKAVSVRSGDDVAQALKFSECADMLMFDAKPPQSGGLPGGNGLSFDWELLKDRQFLLPWMLSGGLTPDNVAEAIRISGAQAVDVSSGVERAPGVKNPKLIEEFIIKVRGNRDS